MNTMPTIENTNYQLLLADKCKPLYKFKINCITTSLVGIETKIFKKLIAAQLLSSRLKNILEREGIVTIEDLLKVRRKKFLIYRGVGSSSIVEVENFLASIGLKWEET